MSNGNLPYLQIIKYTLANENMLAYLKCGLTSGRHKLQTNMFFLLNYTCTQWTLNPQPQAQHHS